MRIFYTDQFVLPLPPGHRFPMSKYARLRRRVVEAQPVPGVELRVPSAATDEEIIRAHDPEYLRRVERGELSRAEMRRIGFPWSPQMVERSRRSAGATIEGCRAALEDGIAVSLAGGTHHAFRERGEGFCVFNDSVIAARAMQAEGRVRRVAVLDCDVHQGNGSAAICRGDPSIFTFSIHGANNFPFQKEVSDLDLPLPDGTSDERYLEDLQHGLGRTLNACRPDLAIYLAGADPWEGDRWGRLALSKRGLAERDRLVIERCRGAGLPLMITMAGGYAPDIDDTVDIHFQTVQIAAARRGSRADPAELRLAGSLDS